MHSVMICVARLLMILLIVEKVSLPGNALTSSGRFPEPTSSMNILICREPTDSQDLNLLNYTFISNRQRWNL